MVAGEQHGFRRWRDCHQRELRGLFLPPIDGLLTCASQFTPTSLANANLVDPEVQLTHEGDLVFTLSAKGGVAPWTWLEHPAGSIGYFADNATGRPSNGFYLVPEIDRTRA